MTGSTELMVRSAAEASLVAENLRPMADHLGIVVDAESIATDALLIHADVQLQQAEPTRESFIPDEGYWIIDQNRVEQLQENVDAGIISPEEALAKAVVSGFLGEEIKF